MSDHSKFFVLLGKRVRELRKARGFTQEDMIAHDFSARHWQMIEAGRPITLRTLLRISDVLSVKPEDLLAGIYSVPNV
jgi:transcriptional regulator with XRE-family HTH domain